MENIWLLVLSVVITIIAEFLFYWSSKKDNAFRSLVAIIALVFGFAMVVAIIVLDLFAVSVLFGIIGIVANLLALVATWFVCNTWIFD